MAVGGATMESNKSYYARRAAQEAVAASRAVTPTARAWHRELSEEFGRKAGGPVMATPAL